MKCWSIPERAVASVSSLSHHAFLRVVASVFLSVHTRQAIIVNRLLFLRILLSIGSHCVYSITYAQYMLT